MQSYYKKSFNSMIPNPAAHGCVKRITVGKKIKNQKTFFLGHLFWIEGHTPDYLQQVRLA